MKKPTMELGQLLADNMRALRHERSWTQADLAQRSGVAQRTIQHIEYKKRWPRPDVLTKIAHAMTIEPSELFRTPEKQRISPKEALAVLVNAVQVYSWIDSAPVEVLDKLQKVHHMAQWRALQNFLEGVTVTGLFPQPPRPRAGRRSGARTKKNPRE